MERVGLHIYLLTPANAQVSEEDRRRLEARGS
jgi:FtsZ-interacting cell division protein YlmF